jgi:hypothetical protein
VIGASAMGGGVVPGTAEDMRKQRFHKLCSKSANEKIITQDPTEQ